MFALIFLSLMVISFILFATSPYWYESMQEWVGLMGMIINGILAAICAVYGV